MWGIIATWEMAYGGLIMGSEILHRGGQVFDAVETCVCQVEDTEEFTSVGYGGLPNAQGVVELDAAFMDGKTLSFGAVASIKDFANPCSIARKLMAERLNNFLAGPGAEDYAAEHGFPRKAMLTEKSRERWLEHKEKVDSGELHPYIGHDTVCAVGLDQEGDMAACTSTSGLFYKRPGRVGDSPLPGCGLYVDNALGGACATGLGEDIMKGCLSFQVIQLMGQGYSPQEACEQALLSLHRQLTARRGKAGDLSVIALNPQGEFGAATNIEEFPFVVATENHPLAIYRAGYKNGIITVKKV